MSMTRSPKPKSPTRFTTNAFLPAMDGDPVRAMADHATAQRIHEGAKQREQRDQPDESRHGCGGGRARHTLTKASRKCQGRRGLCYDVAVARSRSRPGLVLFVLFVVI